MSITFSDTGAFLRNQHQMDAVAVASSQKESPPMFYTDNKLQFPVRVETPNPLFARALQQAIGGVEGEIRVAMQYFFQAMGARGNPKFRDLLLNTAAEELGHIEMLATAVALNLEGAPLSLQEDAAADPVAGAVLGGINLKNLLSAGLSAMPVDSVTTVTRGAVRSGKTSIGMCAARCAPNTSSAAAKSSTNMRCCNEARISHATISECVREVERSWMRRRALPGEHLL